MTNYFKSTGDKLGVYLESEKWRSSTEEKRNTLLVLSAVLHSNGLEKGFPFGGGVGPHRPMLE